MMVCPKKNLFFLTIFLPCACVSTVKPVQTSLLTSAPVQNNSTEFFPEQEGPTSTEFFSEQEISQKTLAPAGVKSCLRLWIRGDTLETEEWIEADPAQEITLLAPVELEIQVGGPNKTEACQVWLKMKQGEIKDQQEISALWIGAWLWDRKDTKKFLYDVYTKEFIDRFTLESIAGEEGHRIRLSHEQLKGERKAYLFIRTAMGPYSGTEEIIQDELVETSRFSLHVLDTRLWKAFGWRLSQVSFFGKNENSRIALTGQALGGSGLFYPLRHSPKVTQRFFRDLSLEFIVGRGADNNNDQVFLFGGVGVSWKEVIGIGHGRDLQDGSSKGVYFNLTILSTKGVFGLIPYTEIVRAVRNLTFQSERESSK